LHTLTGSWVAPTEAISFDGSEYVE
jgi:hypothetical protein